MTTEYHTALAFGGPLTSAAMEAPLGQLDAAIVAVNTALGGTSLAITTTDATAAAGQAVVPVTATTNFIVGQSVWIGDIAGVFEVRSILSIQAGVSLTMTANLTNTYASGKIVSASPSELVDARGTYLTVGARLTSLVGHGTAFPGTPATNDLFRRTDRSGALYHYTGSAWVQVSIPAVSAFWGTPTTNDRCYRLDRGLEYFYDGTRWLTTTLYTGVCEATVRLCPIASPQAVATTAANGSSWNPLYQEWLVDFFMDSSVATTNNGTNYWTVRLVEPGSTLATLSTSADPNIDIWFNHRVAVNALIPAHNAMAITVQTTGTPGTLTYSAHYTYRLVG